MIYAHPKLSQTDLGRLLERHDLQCFIADGRRVIYRPATMRVAEALVARVRPWWERKR